MIRPLRHHVARERPHLTDVLWDARSPRSHALGVGLLGPKRTQRAHTQWARDCACRCSSDQRGSSYTPATASGATCARVATPSPCRFEAHHSCGRRSATTRTARTRWSGRRPYQAFTRGSHTAPTSWLPASYLLLPEAHTVPRSPMCAVSSDPRAVCCRHLPRRCGARAYMYTHTRVHTHVQASTSSR